MRTHSVVSKVLAAVMLAALTVASARAEAQSNATCGMLPEHQADCRRALRLYEISVAAASMNTCEAMEIAARTCDDALQVLAHLRVAASRANQMTGAAPGALFSSPAPLRLSEGLERVSRVCQAMRAMTSAEGSAPTARESAPTARTPAPDTRGLAPAARDAVHARTIDEDYVVASDGMAPVRTAIGHFTVGLALRAATSLRGRCPVRPSAAPPIIEAPEAAPEPQSNVERFIAGLSGRAHGGMLDRATSQTRPEDRVATAPPAPLPGGTQSPMVDMPGGLRASR